ncbi:MAG: AAA family ATPase [Bacteroidales bacterium]|nr:AAA family ATPase [Bacteroidales bacterium]
MGMYINVGNAGFRRARNGEYVDKSGLIAIVNRTLNSERSFSCVTRSRRFGKSMAAKMLCAYYDKSCDSRTLFEDLEIAADPGFEEHLNKYPVIFLDISDFITRFDGDTIVSEMDRRIKENVSEAYPDIAVEESDDLMDYLCRIVASTGQSFIFIIDEWDSICREFEPGTKAMDNYVNWLRRLFKGGQSSQVFAGVYLTGILPIKKYNTQSALNNFVEYSMVRPVNMGKYFGFTKDEVRSLAKKYGMDFDELENWYDGYQIGDEPSMFNPNSVMMAVQNHLCENYWASTASYEAISDYIGMNYEGLKDDVIAMLVHERRDVDPAGFGNDMRDIHSKDDVLTVLIHLGYLSYDWRKRECYIPNREVSEEMVRAIKSNKWNNVADSLYKSKKLLKDTLDGDEEAVAKGVELAHDDNTSILSYNDENSLSCVLSLAYYYARNDYIMHRELASGKGFADIVLIPRKNVDSPAIVIELKVNQNADAAIDQIRRKEYPAKVAEYSGNLLLVGINYNRETKHHSCRIERLSL